MRFTELNWIAQNCAIDAVRQSEAWQTLCSEEISERMAELFGEFKRELDLKLHYSLSYCQGDGVSFTGKVMCDELATLPFANLIKDMDDTSISFVPNSLASYYAHKNTVDINIDLDETLYSKEEYDELECAIIAWYEDECDLLEREGYALLDELTSDEYISDYLDQFKFDVDGRRL